MKTLVIVSCMFSRIFYFNEGIFQFDVIQHVIMVGVFTNDTICTVFNSIVVQSGPFIVPRRQKTSLSFSNFFSWDLKIFCGRFAFNLVHERKAFASKIVL